MHFFLRIAQDNYLTLLRQSVLFSLANKLTFLRSRTVLERVLTAKAVNVGKNTLNLRIFWQKMTSEKFGENIRIKMLILVSVDDFEK